LKKVAPPRPSCDVPAAFRPCPADGAGAHGRGESVLCARGLLRQWRRVIRRLFPVLLPVFLLAACGKPGPEPLRVGMDLSYPPFEMRDTQGEPAGVSVDLARALGAHLGRPAVIENMPFGSLLVSLKTGRIDAIISSMTVTEERGQSVDFSEPYVRTGLCLLTGARSDVRGIADLDAEGRKVAVVRSSTGQLWARANLKRAAVLDLEKETACVLEVTQGKADAFIYDQMSTLRNWQANPGTTRAILTPFREESWAIAMRKGDTGLKAKADAFLAKFRADGGFDRLGEKWLGEQRASFAKLGVRFVF
jgi:polar amino acid transport system substrate-binding protein